MNRSLANRTKVVSKVARAVSKAADNRSRAKRASSQDKAASRVVNRSLGKAVNRLNAEFWLVAYEGRRSNAVERRPAFGLRSRFSAHNKGRSPMDKQRIKGSAQQAKGKIKELAGKATGNKKLQAKGKAEKASGKIRNAVGGMKDAMRGK
jgi:uncharacterized protein YjbJ (UPF0337 family)